MGTVRWFGWQLQSRGDAPRSRGERDLQGLELLRPRPLVAQLEAGAREVLQPDLELGELVAELDDVTLPQETELCSHSRGVKENFFRVEVQGCC